MCTPISNTVASVMLPLLLGMQMARHAAARTCTMAEVGAKYQSHEGTSTDTTKMQYHITDENQLKNLIGCDTIDYIYIECRRGCTQATWEQIDIKTITDKRPGSNEPSIQFWQTRNIENMAAFRNLEVIPHGIEIQRMPDLKSLAGLEKVTSIGTKNTGISITIVDQSDWKMDQFTDASALEGAALAGSVNVAIDQAGNGRGYLALACTNIPSSWPASVDAGDCIKVTTTTTATTPTATTPTIPVACTQSIQIETSSTTVWNTGSPTNNWDVYELQFLDSKGNALPTSNRFDSGHHSASSSIDAAFTPDANQGAGTMWGGRKDGSTGTWYLGATIKKPVSKVRVMQAGYVACTIKIKGWNPESNQWVELGRKEAECRSDGREWLDIDLPGCNPVAMATTTSTTTTTTTTTSTTTTTATTTTAVPAMSSTAADASKPTANREDSGAAETAGETIPTPTAAAAATIANEAGAERNTTAAGSADGQLQSPNKASSTPKIVAAVVVVLLLLLAAIALYVKKKKTSAQLPEDQDAHIVENKTFENPQYSANHQSGAAGTAASAEYMSTGNGSSSGGTSDIYKVLHTHARDSGGHGLVNSSSSSSSTNTAALYAVPMEEDGAGEGDGAGTFNLPRGRSGTVVAAAASGAYEVVAATEGVYAPAAASAAGIRVMAASDGLGYAQAAHYSSTGTGTSSARASASHGVDYDHLQRNVDSNYHDNGDFGNGIVDGNNSYDMAPPGQRSAALRGRTNNAAAAPAAPAAPVYATPSYAAGAAGSNEQYASWTVNDAYASSDAVPAANPTYAVYAGTSTGTSTSSSTTNGTGLSVTAEPRYSGYEVPSQVLASSSTVARGKGQGKSVYSGFNEVEDEEV